MCLLSTYVYLTASDYSVIEVQKCALQHIFFSFYILKFLFVLEITVKLAQHLQAHGVNSSMVLFLLEFKTSQITWKLLHDREYVPIPAYLLVALEAQCVKTTFT